MNLKKKYFVALISFIVVFGACKIDSGMGEAPDLEAPILTITSHNNNDCVGLKFTLSGECTDNIGVTSVLVANKDTQESYGQATISGNEWFYNIEFGMEYDSKVVNLIVSATDLAENSSGKSYKTISLLVDVTAPASLDWYIDRGTGIQTPLYELENLKQVNINLSENKDIPQNQYFNVHGNFYDAMSVSSVEVYLRNEEGTEILRKKYTSDSSNENYIGEDKSIFSPSFTFTQDELVAVDSNYSTGMHYLQVGYVVKDDHGNTGTSDLKWLLWYPESDYPQIYQNQINPDTNSLSLTVDTDFPVDIFDDDGLGEVYYALKDELIYSVIPGANLSEKCQALINNTNSIREVILNINSEKFEVGYGDSEVGGRRDNPVSLKTPTRPQSMYLIVCVKDINGKWNSKIIPTAIYDAFSPMLFVESPKNNETPVMIKGTNDFKVSGYVLGKTVSDKNSALRIVYISGSADTAEKKAQAVSIFDGTTQVDESKGQILRTIIIDDPVDYDKDASLRKQSFNTTFNILTDLSKYDSVNETSYFFMFRLNGTNGAIDQIYQLNKDTALPTINVVEPANMEGWDYTKEYIDEAGTIPYKKNVKFRAYKDSDLLITDIKLMYGGNIYTPSDGLTKEVVTENNKEVIYYTRTLEHTELSTLYDSNPQQKFTFYAKDALGYESTEERTVVLTSLPSLESITTEQSNKTYIAGETLYFQAKFSSSVKIVNIDNSNKPYLDLRFSDNPSLSRKAYYLTGSGTNVLTFEYVIQENDVSKDTPVSIESNVDGTAFYLGGNNTSIMTVDGSEGKAYLSTSNILTGKELYIDGVIPKVVSCILSDGSGKTPNADTNTYFKKDDKLILTITTSEKVTISGTPVAKAKVLNSDLNFNFAGIDGTGTVLTFEHDVINSSPNGLISVTPSSCFNNENIKYIKDENGNQLKLNSDSDSTANKFIIDTIEPDEVTIVITKTANGEEDTASDFSYRPYLELKNYSESIIKYTTDNGINWHDYTVPVQLSNGTYKIKALQEDKGGNVSNITEYKTIVINSTFPTVTELGISTLDGKYNSGNITFVLSFNDKVVVQDDSATLTFKGIKNQNGETSSEVRTANVVASTETNTVEFTYSVQPNDELHGIFIDSIVFGDGFIDKFNHKAKDEIGSDYESGKINVRRTDIIIDAKKPTILWNDNSTLPKNNGVITEKNENNDYKIVLKFSEPVYKEKGIITLQRKGQWGIPAVIDGAKFKEIYDLLGSTDQQTLIWTDQDGDLTTDHKDTWTGISVGPYRKITHGIDSNGSPDTNTKFVLNFDLGLFDGSVEMDNHAAVSSGYTISKTTSKTTSVSSIRKVFEKDVVSSYFYKITLNVNDNSQVNLSSDGKTLTLILDKTIDPGIEWELLIPDNAFRDKSGNFFAGLTGAEWTDDNKSTLNNNKNSDYTLWSKDCAIPVIRVDRQSHGFGAKNVSSSYQGGYNASEGYTEINTVSKKFEAESEIKMNTEPSGYARFRIDCATPGAVINYGSPTGNGTAYNSGTISNNISKKFESTRSNNLDITTGTLDNVILSGNKNSGWIDKIGDGSSTTSRKDYIVAQAKKNHGTDESPNIYTSGKAYEGVFKTLVYIKGGSENRWEGYKLMNIEGGTSKGGEPSYDGFPLRDGVDSDVFSPQTKNMYRISSTSHDYTWVSYEILNKDAALLLGGANYSEDYPYVSYGDLVYITKAKYYNSADIN